MSARSFDGGAPFPALTGDEPCREDPEAFFPLTPGHGKEATRAIEMCQNCPILEGCLAYALTHAVNGIWGGKTERQRRKIQKEQGIKPVPLKLPFDDELVVRAHRRGMPNEVIAVFADADVASVERVLTGYRREQREVAVR